MKCISCESEINTKWKHAIDANMCPFCGQNIMEGELKDLLSSLSDIIIKLQPYQQQLDDWLHSNFSYIKEENIKNYNFENNIKEI